MRQSTFDDARDATPPAGRQYDEAPPVRNTNERRYDLRLDTNCGLTIAGEYVLKNTDFY